MTDTIEETIRRGRDAKYLLESESFQTVVASIKAETMKRWRASQASHTDLRETMFFQVQALETIEAQLLAWVDSAKFEADRLEKANQRTSRQA